MNEDSPDDSVTRRDFLKRSSAGGVVPVVSQEGRKVSADRERPNVILIISDQFRWDCLGTNGLNPLKLTPNSMQSPQKA